MSRQEANVNSQEICEVEKQIEFWTGIRDRADTASPGYRQACTQLPRLRANRDNLIKLRGEAETRKALDGKTREVALRPMLRERGFSVHDWAKAASVDFHTANNYLKGKN